MAKSDAYWDELGVAWRAIEPASEAVAPRLKARLRWQAVCSVAIMIVGTQLGVVGAVLGTVTIYLGWSGAALHFVTRGIGIIVMSCLLFWATWALRTGSDAAKSSLADMLHIAAVHTEKSIRVIKIAYCLCATAAVFGLVGFVIRVRTGNPPVISPFVWLMLLALVSVVLFQYQRRLEDSLMRLRHLRATLIEDEISV